MRVVFRTDASSEIGSGHVMRCLALASGLSLRGAQVAFLCRPQQGDLLAAIRSRGFEAEALPAPQPGASDASAHASWLGAGWAEDADDTARALSRLGGEVDWLVVDHYAIDARWELKLRPAARRILVIDDLADRPHDCDILLDQNIDTGLHQRYPALCNPGVRLCLGPRFLLLREEFAHAPPLRGSPVGNLALVFFGGVDRPGATLQLLRTLEQHDFALSASVLVGSTNPARADIEALCARRRYAVHVDAGNVAELIAACDFAIAACGFFAYELMALRTPALLTAQSDIQWTVARALERLGVAKTLPLADFSHPDRLQAAILETRKIPRTCEGFDIVAITGVANVIGEMEALQHDR